MEHSQPPSPLAMERESVSSSGSKLSFKDRVAAFEDAVRTNVDFDVVRKLAFGGIPDSPGLRSLYWKLLLCYLPREREEWPKVLKKTRDTYQAWIEELMIDPRKDSFEDDHPLSTSQSSKWHAFFKDKEILEEIDKDVKRTLPGLHFFNHDKQVGDTLHYEALKRILFIYAKLNPGIRYVQGMNEILGPLYYIFATDPVPDFRANAEPDTFFCFTNLMAEIRDNFCKTLDKSSIGITGLMAKLNAVLKLKDEELWQDFENKNLNPQFYSFRWLTLLLSQEFELPDVLRLWDSLFADPARFDFLLFVCCSMLICLRDTLLDGSFADNLKLLQSYPLQDIHTILQKAEEVQRDEYEPPAPRPKAPPQAAPQASLLQRLSIAPKVAERRIVAPSQGAYHEPARQEHEEEEEVVLSAPTSGEFVQLPKPFEEIEEEEGEKSHPLA